MDINDFLTPVALEKKDSFFIPEESSFISSIKVNTSNSPIDDLEGIQIAILGIPESRSSYNKGSEKAPDAIRNKLYQLRFTSKNKNRKVIFDLGNLRPGNSFTDSYFGLKEVLTYLLDRNITTILLGGTQDLTIGGVMTLNALNLPVNLTTIDSKIDYNQNNETPKSTNYLAELIENEKYTLKDYSNIGHQIYLNDSDILEKLYQHQYDCIRLGEAKNKMLELEPILRETTFLSFDISSIKQGDAPGNYNPSPNGFFADEACLLSRFAGLSESLKLFGFFEINPDYDINNQTSHLAAQAIWYFIDGFLNKYNEFPEENNENYKKFIVEISSLSDPIIFYKSQKSNRWWMNTKNSYNQGKIIACSYKDYQTACKNDIPSKWLKFSS